MANGRYTVNAYRSKNKWKLNDDIQNKIKPAHKQKITNLELLMCAL